MRNKALPRVAAVAAGLAGMTLWAEPSLAAPESFEVSLTGTQQVPAVDTAGKGTATLSYDPATRVVTWTVTYSGLSGPATMAHFHGPAAKGENAGGQIWLTEKGKPVENPIKGQATLTPDQAKDFAAGKWYINVHTEHHPGGEIRGYVTPPTG
jgi:CHRD domain-containing protein